MRVPPALLRVSGIGRAVAQQTTERSKRSGNRDGDARRRVGKNCVVGVLARDDHPLQKLRLARGSERAFMRHAEERKKHLANPGGGPRLPDHDSKLFAHAAERVRRPFPDNQLLPGARAPLLPVELEDEFTLQDVEVLVIGGMDVLWRARVSRPKDHHAAFEFPLRVFGQDEAEDPFPRDRLRDERRYAPVEKPGKTVLTVIVEPGAINGNPILIEPAAYRNRGHLFLP